MTKIISEGCTGVSGSKPTAYGRKRHSVLAPAVTAVSVCRTSSGENRANNENTTENASPLRSQTNRPTVNIPAQVMIE